jgi:hypothetical protein
LQPVIAIATLNVPSGDNRAGDPADCAPFDPSPVPDCGASCHQALPAAMGQITVLAVAGGATIRY